MSVSTMRGRYWNSVSAFFLDSLQWRVTWGWVDSLVLEALRQSILNFRIGFLSSIGWRLPYPCLPTPFPILRFKKIWSLGRFRAIWGLKRLSRKQPPLNAPKALPNCLWKGRTQSFLTLLRNSDWFNRLLSCKKSDTRNSYKWRRNSRQELYHTKISKISQIDSWKRFFLSVFLDETQDCAETPFAKKNNPFLVPDSLKIAPFTADWRFFRVYRGLSGMFRRSASLAIPHLKSFAATPSVSLVQLGHTNRSVFLSHESQCEIALV